MTPFDELSARFFSFLRRYFSLNEVAISDVMMVLQDDARKDGFGDFSSNAAMVLARALGKSPRLIAQEIAAHFSDLAVERLEVAGPGFLNFFLTDACFAQEAQRYAANISSALASSRERYQIRSYSVEFVSANPTGPLHIGHGRGGIIGDVVGNVLRFLGNTVVKEFYVNDAGKQITTLGMSLMIRCRQVLGEQVELPEDSYHGEYLLQMAREMTSAVPDVVRSALEKNDVCYFSEYAYHRLREEQEETLAEYKIIFDVWFSERTLHASGEVDSSINLLIERGHTYELEGALWFKSTAFGDDKDRVLRRANGEYTYVAADVAYMLNKLKRGAEQLIMVLGQDHHSYVVRLKGILTALGYRPEQLDVILYQLVTVKEDGEVMRLSKRAGRIVSLKDIIDTVGPDVARFFYLNRKADAHLDFDLALALRRTDENPVFYLQYAYVRTGSILERAQNIAAMAKFSAQDLHSFAAEERLLLRKIFALKSMLVNISYNYQAHLLTYYVLELAQQFHSFYAVCRVIAPEDVEQSKRRLAVVALVRSTLGTCLELLGISTPAAM
ncbi:MAG: Arginine-tRNA ligase [candidate division TM6 bacterium GW2011_GWF2_43_17]|nr:MAG: Arginine-tRNA ligase [candidate division TM6 bacterium GW2011_GWF2_43_17]